MNWGKIYVLTLALSCMPVSFAWAEDSEAKRKEALALYDEAKSLAKSGEWANAEQKLVAAQEAFAMPKTAGMLGYVQVKRGNYLEGARNLEWFFQEETTIDAENRDKVRPIYLEARKNVATIKLKITPLDADVTIDGVPIVPNRLHWPQYVVKGSHLIEAKKDGFGPEKQGVTVVNGTETDVELKLAPAPQQGQSRDKHGPVVVPTKPAKVPPLVLAAWIGGGVFGAVAIGTGIGAGVTYGRMEKSWNTKEYDANREKDFMSGQTPLGALSTIALTSGLLSAGAFGYALYGTLAKSKENQTGMNVEVIPAANGVLLTGRW